MTNSWNAASLATRPVLCELLHPEIYARPLAGQVARSVLGRGPKSPIRPATLCLFVAIAALAGVLPGQSPPLRSSAARPPNIVVLLIDDLGYGELGCQGNREIPTPHIDSIAAAGVRFTSGYVPAAFCSPSRAGLMTGRYPSRFGYESNPVGAANENPEVGLPATEITLAQHLRAAGYATALVGKWHLGGTAAYQPLRRGFDEFFGFLHEGHFYLPPPYRGATTMLRRRKLPGGGQGRWTSNDGRLVLSMHMGSDEPPYDANNPIVRGGQPVVEADYLTDAFTREAIDFIRRTSERPFFLYLAYNAVHSPLQAPDAYLERFAHIEDVQRRIFAAMLASVDDSVGAVLEALRECGIEENTLFFLLSDNGGPTRELTSSNAPLRGGKGDLYEGGIRVPFLMQWKVMVPAGQVEARPVISLDIFATAAAASGRQVPRGQVLDGVDLLPYLRGESREPPHESLYWRTGHKAALRHGVWKLVRNGRQAPAPWELYDLSSDIAETHNLADVRPDKLAQLERLWEEVNRQMAAQESRP